MPNYSVSEGAARAIEAYDNRAIQEPGPAPPSSPPPSAYGGMIGQATGGVVESVRPFAYNSWEAMSNVEKFDELRRRLDNFDSFMKDQYHKFDKLERLLEQHAHAQDGSVMVKYSRSTAY